MLADGIDRRELASDAEVPAHLTSPDADRRFVLATLHFEIEHHAATDLSNAIGAGSFRMTEFQPSVRSVGTRFENYPNAGPNLDEIETIGLAGAGARLIAVAAGEVGAIADVPPDGVEVPSQRDGSGLRAVESGSCSNIALCFDMEPSGSRDPVIPPKILMNRERVARGVSNGQVLLGNGQPIGPAHADHCADLPQRAPGPALAKFHA